MLCKMISIIIENIRNCLESSTIHGLSHIASTKRFVRLIWFLVVIAGFIGAGVLINQSFDSWAESPVSTTIETLPIVDINLPKVTVCPPKNTFTDLNYDLLMVQNMTLDDGTRNELATYALNLLQDHLYDKVQRNLDTLNYGEKYRDWYYGYTDLEIPYSSDGYDVYNVLTTRALSGIISTQHFGEKFDADMVVPSVYYDVFVYSPESNYYDGDNETKTLHFEIEKVSMNNLRNGTDKFFIYTDAVPNSIGHILMNFTPPQNYRQVSLTRSISVNDIINQKLHLMPGFRLKWYYTGPGAIGMQPDSVPIEGFIKFVNLVQSVNNWTRIWRIVKNTAPFLYYQTCKLTGSGPEGLYDEALYNVIKLEEKFQMRSSSEDLRNISDQHLNDGVKGFLYLNLCSTLLRPWFEFYVDLFEKKSPDQIVLILNRILKGKKTAQNENLKTIAGKLFKRITSLLSLKYKEIKNMTLGISEVSFWKEGLHA